MRRCLPRAALALATALALAGTSPARAGDAAHGHALYRTYCQVCHTVDPSTSVAPFNEIMTAAGDPAKIAAAAVVDPVQMGFIPELLTPADQADIAAYLATFVSAQTVTVVEFHAASRDHYFMSSNAQEIADLDTGVHAGWVRTGLSFKAYANAAAGTSPVCRFYLPPAYGDSHFYSPLPAECADVAMRYPAFDEETAAAFHIAVPDPGTGACAAGTVPVYRVWNGRPDTNHRYTTSFAVRQQMVAAGWVAEGYGPDAVIMCAPP